MFGGIPLGVPPHLDIACDLWFLFMWVGAIHTAVVDAGVMCAHHLTSCPHNEHV